MDQRMRIALLIDADNAPAARIDAVLSELAKHGIANVRRAYGNWKSQNLQRWEQALHPNAIQPIQQFAYSSGKNASDMAMVVDAMDLLHSGRFDAFAIVSSDADFTPLAMRLRAQDMRVFGFGEKKTPEPFVNACSTFLFIDDAGRPAPPPAAASATPVASDPASVTAAVSIAPTTQKKTPGELRGDTALVSLLRSAAETTRDDDDGWSNLSAVGNYIANRTSFDPGNYGYGKLKGLIKAIGLFEMREDGKHVAIRASQPAAAKARPAAQKPAAKPAAAKPATKAAPKAG